MTADRVAERVNDFETPDAQKLAVAGATSSGRLIHAGLGSSGALGGLRNRSGWVR